MGNRLSNKQGSISKLSGKRAKPYVVRTTYYYNEEKKKFVRNIIGYARTKNDAYLMLANYNSKSIDLEKSENTKLVDLFDYVIKKKEKTINPQTLKNYISTFKIVFSTFFEIKIKELKYITLQEHIEKYKRNTVRIALVILKEVYKEALKRDIIIKDVSELLELPIDEKLKKEKELFTKEEVEKLWNSLENENEFIFASAVLIQLYSGCRISEVILLEKENIDFENLVFKTGVKTESGKNRFIPIHNKIKPILKQLFDKTSTKYIYPENFVNDYYIGSSYTKYLKRLNIDKSTHNARHSFITKMQILNAPLKDLQYIVGHKATDITTKVYTHFNKETALKMLEYVNKIEY